jgi:hypothetical protein
MRKMMKIRRKRSIVSELDRRALERQADRLLGVKAEEQRLTPRPASECRTIDKGSAEFAAIAARYQAKEA